MVGEMGEKGEEAFASCLNRSTKGKCRLNLRNSGRKVYFRADFTAAAAACTAVADPDPAGADHTEGCDWNLVSASERNKKEEKRVETHPAAATAASASTTALSTLTMTAALTLTLTLRAAAARSAPKASRTIPESSARLSERLHILLALLCAIEPTVSPTAAGTSSSLVLLLTLTLKLTLTLVVPTRWVGSTRRDRIKEGRLWVVVLFGSWRRDHKVVVAAGTAIRCRCGRRHGSSSSISASRALERRVRLFEIKVGLRDVCAGRRRSLSVLTERLKVAALSSTTTSTTTGGRLRLLLLLASATAARSRKDRSADAILGTTSGRLLLLLLLTNVGARHVLGELFDVGGLLLWRRGSGSGGPVRLWTSLLRRDGSDRCHRGSWRGESRRLLRCRRAQTTLLLLLGERQRWRWERSRLEVTWEARGTGQAKLARRTTTKRMRRRERATELMTRRRAGERTVGRERRRVRRRLLEGRVRAGGKVRRSTGSGRLLDEGRLRLLRLGRRRRSGRLSG